MKMRHGHYLAGLLSLAAGAIHAVLVPEHWSEWWGYGLFFILVFAAQGLYGVALLLMPMCYTPVHSMRRARDLRGSPLYLSGIVGNAAIIGLYFLSRTLGVPLVGPEAGEVEPMTPLGLTTQLLEATLIAFLVALAHRTPAGARVQE